MICGGPHGWRVGKYLRCGGVWHPVHGLGAASPLAWGRLFVGRGRPEGGRLRLLVRVPAQPERTLEAPSLLNFLFPNEPLPLELG